MQYVQPTEQQIAKMQVFRDKYEALAKDIRLEFPIPTRGSALAFTNLEQSAMWLNKALTNNDKIEEQN